MKKIIDVFTGAGWTSRPMESGMFDYSRLELQTCLKAKSSGKNGSYHFVILNPNSVIGSILSKSDRGRSAQTISSIETIEPTKDGTGKNAMKLELKTKTPKF
ncbi:MAG: hypothetical protein K9N09_05940 [Candidatus Cloacimonetes bacterium]|nr:hypothetical protein [Candidatus Cloacimonadota bacterium]MCF7868224.1 hypothetical protein [Candidatus Cloacimonadota bacterium]MCF7883657.1 hypothetical protein [Candidatus Cloacimonadota bacterium]